MIKAAGTLVLHLIEGLTGLLWHSALHARTDHRTVGERINTDKLILPAWPQGAPQRLPAWLSKSTMAAVHVMAFGSSLFTCTDDCVVPGHIWLHAICAACLQGVPTH